MMTNSLLDPGYWDDGELKDLGFRSLGNNVKLARNATVVGAKNVSIGSNVRIDSCALMVAGSGFLNIGDYVHIGAFSYFGCAGGVVVEDFAGFSQGVKCYSMSDTYDGAAMTNPMVPAEFTDVKKETVHIGRHVIVGSGSVILPGSVLGEGAAIGALSLINRNLDEWNIYGGIPVRFVRPRRRDILDLERRLIESAGRR